MTVNSNCRHEEFFNECLLMLYLSASALNEVDDMNLSLNSNCLLLFITREAAVKTIGGILVEAWNKKTSGSKKIFFYVYKIHQEFC